MNTRPLRAEEDTMFDTSMAEIHAQARYEDLLREAEAERQASRRPRYSRLLTFLLGMASAAFASCYQYRI